MPKVGGGYVTVKKQTKPKSGLSEAEKAHGVGKKPGPDPGAFDPAGKTSTAPKPGPGAKEKAEVVSNKVQDISKGIGGDNVVKPQPKPKPSGGPEQVQQQQKKKNAAQMGTSYVAPPVIKPRTSGGDMPHAVRGERPGGGDRFDYNHMGLPDRVSGSFRDPDLVGSGNAISDFDGSEFSGGGNEITEGGGGGTGSSTAGREAVGLVGDTKGQSLEEAVYGVKKRRRNVSRAKGE